MLKYSPEFMTKCRPTICALIASIILATNPGTALSAEITDSEPQVHYTLDTLPEKTRETFIRIMTAARSGDLKELRAALEWNELPPETDDENNTSPIDYWKKQSSDGTTRDIMAKILNVLERGFIIHNASDGKTTYIWPYLRDRNLNNLKPHEAVDLHRLATPAKVGAMLEAGKYTGYFAVIGEDGTWHSFKKMN